MSNQTPLQRAFARAKPGTFIRSAECRRMERLANIPTVARRIAAVERILAAHLADVEARLAAVEALADTFQGTAVPLRQLRAALTPDPSEPA
jgi:hypothetical protein